MHHELCSNFHFLSGFEDTGEGLKAYHRKILQNFRFSLTAGGFLEQLSPSAHDMLKLLESLGCGWSVVFARLLASKNILLRRPGSLSCYPFYLAHFKWDDHSLFYPEV